VTKFYPVIMAGGSGQRFWPLSTADKPKQFLDLEHTGRTLLQATCDRLLALTGTPDTIHVVTCRQYAGLILEQLPELDHHNLIIEPLARDTAPAIGLAALELHARHGDVLMGLFPSDHRIGAPAAFQEALKQATLLTQETRGLTTLGIHPTFPATGYGYIRTGDTVGGGAYRVAQFVEKPDEARAKTYLQEGTYAWNGGIFLWHTSTILTELQQHAPDLFTPLEHAFCRKQIPQVFPTLPKISIDYAVLEKTQRAYVIPAEFAWDDLGDWLALERLLRQNAPQTALGKHVGIDSSGSLIYTTDGEDLIITIGLDDVVIVKQGNRMLVSRKDRVQDIKKALQLLAATPAGTP
jgi:mannose-1-phosphate guanylyltransferase